MPEVKIDHGVYVVESFPAGRLPRLEFGRAILLLNLADAPLTI